MPQIYESKLLYVHVSFWNRSSVDPHKSAIEGWMRECREGVDINGNRFKLDVPAIEIHPGFVFDPDGWMWGIKLSDVIEITPGAPPDIKESVKENYNFWEHSAEQNQIVLDKTILKELENRPMWGKVEYRGGETLCEGWISLDHPCTKLYVDNNKRETIIQIEDVKQVYIGLKGIPYSCPPQAENS